VPPEKPDQPVARDGRLLYPARSESSSLAGNDLRQHRLAEQFTPARQYLARGALLGMAELQRT
jgi:hypothetical protein